MLSVTSMMVVYFYFFVDTLFFHHIDPVDLCIFFIGILKTHLCVSRSGNTVCLSIKRLSSSACIM